MEQEKRTPFHKQIADKLIEQLEAGTAPWQRPWKAGEPMMPYNAITGKRYKGANIIKLMLRGHVDTRWMTFNQAKTLGANVKKGERGTALQYWIFTDKEPKLDSKGKPILGPNGKPEMKEVQLERPKLRTFVVFNAEQLENCPAQEPPKKLNEEERNKRVDDILKNSGAVIQHHPHGMAAYDPRQDKIFLPNPEMFHSASGYYATALHELGHWTGHSSRLDRKAGPRNTEEYAKEELRAEITSLILGEKLEIGHDPGQHASYVKSWIQILKDDPKEIVRAAKDAEGISDFIMAYERTQEQEQGMDKIQEMEAAVEDRENLAAKKNYISVPYKEKEEAKALGAKWDRQEQSWFIPNGLDEEPFKKWLTKEETVDEEKVRNAEREMEKTASILNDEYERRAVLLENGSPTEENDELIGRLEATLKQDEENLALAKESLSISRGKNKAEEERTYLAVPYKEKEEAKALGAKWDRKAQSWFVEGSEIPSALEKFRPNRADIASDPAISVGGEFLDALRNNGCLPEMDRREAHPIMDGKGHRIPVIGDKKGERSGFYVCHTDGHPAGYIKNYKTGQEVKWVAKGQSIDPKQLAVLRAQAAEKKREKELERERNYEKTSEKVTQLYQNLPAIQKPTPYMTKKGIADIPFHGLKEGYDRTMVIPAFDVNGKQWTTQYIDKVGQKKFASGGKKEGTFYPIGGMNELDRAKQIIICEGVATAGSIKKAFPDAAVIAAFDSGNLSAVAGKIAEKYPNKPLVIAGDNDAHSVMSVGNNVGDEKGRKAAQESGAVFIAPTFPPQEKSWPKDVPTFTPNEWKEGNVSEIQKAAYHDYKKLTDFNDMANDSQLGLDGVKNQIGAALERAKEMKQAEGKHQTEEQQQVNEKEEKLSQKRSIKRRLIQ